jgi:hypothetical protein
MIVDPSFSAAPVGKPETLLATLVTPVAKELATKLLLTAARLELVLVNDRFPKPVLDPVNWPPDGRAPVGIEKPMWKFDKLSSDFVLFVSVISA